MQCFKFYQSMEDLKSDFPIWFSPETMRFFSSRIESGIINHNDNQYFITSERDEYARHGSPTRRRRFSVRLVDGHTQTIQTVGGFHSFKSRKAAKKFILEQE